MSIDFRVVVGVSILYALVLLLLDPSGAGGDETTARGAARSAASLAGERPITEMVQHAWNGYMTAAAGADEVRPLAGLPKNNWGATAVTAFDSLSTLLAMGLRDEFLQAAELALQACTAFKPTDGKVLSSIKEPVSVFETTIRHLGAAISAYTQTNDARFLACAEDIATSLLPAFHTPTGIAAHGVIVGTDTINNEGWAGHKSILSEVGSLQLEFRFLSRLTGKAVYADAANGFTKHLTTLRANGWPNNESHYDEKAVQMPHKGLWPSFVDPRTGKFSGAASMASLSDSYYEYLLKQWILFGKKDDHLLDMYEDSVEALLGHLLKYTVNTHYAFIGHQGIGFEATMDHLACFVPGMLILGVMHGAHRHSNRQNRAWGDDRVVQVAVDLASTCYRLYLESPSGIAPEIVAFHTNGSYTVSHPKYILRPETVESLFYLHRYTNDEKYVDWARHIAAHIDKHCRTPTAFAALESVTISDPKQVDSMESFFIAETLKYLYLMLEADKDAIPLDRYVFNTEAHPFPIMD